MTLEVGGQALAEGRILKDYLARLARQWLLWVFFIVDAIAFVAGLCGLQPLGAPGHLLIAAVGVVVASYKVFAEAVAQHAECERKLQQQVEALQGENRELRNLRPDLGVQFCSDGKTGSKLTVHVKPQPAEPDYDALIECKRAELISRAKGRGLDVDWRLAFGANDNYAQEVEEYLLEYREYLHLDYEYSLRDDRLLSVALLLRNKGTCAAKTVLVELALPAALLPSDEHIYWVMFDDPGPAPPHEPQLRSGFAGLLGGINISPYVPAMVSPQSAPPSSHWGPEYNRLHDEGRIRYGISTIVPDLADGDLDPFVLWLGAVDVDTTFEIQAKLYAENLPGPQEAALLIEVVIAE